MVTRLLSSVERAVATLFNELVSGVKGKQLAKLFGVVGLTFAGNYVLESNLRTIQTTSAYIWLENNIGINSTTLIFLTLVAPLLLGYIHSHFLRYIRTNTCSYLYLTATDYLAIFFAIQIGISFFSDLQSLSSGVVSLRLLLLMLLVLLLSLVYLLAARRVYGEKFANPLSSIVLADAPINSPTQDLLDRKNLALGYAALFAKLSRERGFSWSVNGIWGEGKTSFINLVTYYLTSEEHNLNCEVFTFRAQLFNDPKSATLNFFRGLEDFLSERYFLNSSANALSNLPEIALGSELSLKMKIQPLNREDRLDKTISDLSNFTSQLRTKLVIVIDEIDRLRPAEALNILKIVSLLEDLKNVVVILGMDEKMVEKLLAKELTPELAAGYLDKFVQGRINLPAVTHAELSFRLFEKDPDDPNSPLIENLFMRLNIPEERRKEFYDEFRYFFHRNASSLLRTYRDIKRFYTNLEPRLKSIHKDVNLFDFFVLDLLYTFFPDIYLALPKMKALFLSHWDITLAYYSDLPLGNDKGAKEKKTELVKELVSQPNSNKEKVALEILKRLFPTLDERGYSRDAQKSERDHRISHPKIFDFYFRLFVPTNLISVTDWEKIIERVSHSNFAKEQWKEIYTELRESARTSELLERIALTAGELSQKVTQGATEFLSDCFDSLEKIERNLESDFFRAIRAMLSLLDSSIKTKRRGGQQALIDSLNGVKSSFAYTILASNILSNGSEGYVNISAVVNGKIEILRVKLTSILKKKLTAGRNIFLEYEVGDCLYILMQISTNWKKGLSLSLRKWATNYLMRSVRAGHVSLERILKAYYRESPFPMDDSKTFEFARFIEVFDPDQIRSHIEGNPSMTGRPIFKMFEQEYKKYVDSMLKDD